MVAGENGTRKDGGHFAVGRLVIFLVIISILKKYGQGSWKSRRRHLVLQPSLVTFFLLVFDDITSSSTVQSLARINNSNSITSWYAVQDKPLLASFKNISSLPLETLTFFESGF